MSCNSVERVSRAISLNEKTWDANQYRRFSGTDRIQRNGNERRKGTSKVQSSNDNKKPLVLPRGFSLRETHENSNYLLLRIPIEITNSAHGEKAIAVAEAPLSSFLPLSPDAITRLQDARLIRLPRPVRAKRQPIDYAALQQSYRQMIAEGGFASQTELARHLGVSRVWVSKVLKKSRCPTK